MVEILKDQLKKREFRVKGNTPPDTTPDEFVGVEIIGPENEVQATYTLDEVNGTIAILQREVDLVTERLQSFKDLKKKMLKMISDARGA